MTERLSPEIRQRLLAEDALILGRPFDIGANPRAIHAHTRHMAMMMRDTSQSEGAGRAAAFLAQMLDMLLAQDVKGPVACGRGCSWCCTTFVSVTVPEIFNLARAVRQAEAARSRTLSAAKRAKRIPQNARESHRIVCPILDHNACSLYANRPLICRSLLSTSLETCLQILVENRAAEMTHADKTPMIRGFGVLMMKAALVLSGLPPLHYELIQGLEVALTVDNAEARWLAGEPIFAAVPTDAGDVEGTPVANMTELLVNAVRPTL